MLGTHTDLAVVSEDVTELMAKLSDSAVRSGDRNLPWQPNAVDLSATERSTLKYSVGSEDVVEVRNEEALHLLRMVLVEEDLLALGHADLVVRSTEVVAGLAIRQEEERESAAAKGVAGK